MNRYDDSRDGDGGHDGGHDGGTVLPDYVYRRPPLYPAQEAAIFCPERYALIEASVKSGKTYGCICWLTEQAVLSRVPGRAFWWVAPIYAQAKIAYRRLKRGLSPDFFHANEQEMTITLANGAVIWFKSADNPDSLFGDDVFAAVCDEASRVKEESWRAIRSTLTATRGPIRLIGNVKGRRNFFYRMARRAESGEPDMHYARLTAYDAVAGGVLASDEIDDARRQLPDHVFRELYLAEPGDDEGNPFDMRAIRDCTSVLSSAEPVCFGIDLAKSHDHTASIALDAEGRVCRFDRWQAPWEVTIARVHSLVQGQHALVDSTGVGDPVLEALQKKGGSYEGFKFTSQSKQQVMEGLAVAIQQRAIRFPDGPITSELESFEYQYTRTGVTYGAAEGTFDDCVCALALAWSKYQHRRAGVRILTFTDQPEGSDGAPGTPVRGSWHDAMEAARQRQATQQEVFAAQRQRDRRVELGP